MALTYRQVLERYDRARAFGEKRSLPEYAQSLNDATETQAFSEGLRDGSWTRFSTRLDKSLEPIGAVTGLLGGIIGAPFGHFKAGQEVGKSLPRGILQTAPLLIPGAGQGVGLALAAGATGAAFGGQTYADTGSAKAATLSGITAGALPFVGKYTGALGARAFGAERSAGALTATGEAAGLGRAGSAWSGVIPTSTAQKVGQFAGSQAGQIVLQEAGGYAQHKTLNGDEPYNFFSPEFLIGQIPFTVVDAVHAVRSPVMSKRQVRSLTEQPKVVKLPVAPYVPPVKFDVAATATMAQGFEEYQQMMTAGATPDELAAKLQAIVTTTNAPVEVEAAKAAPVVEPPKPITFSGKAEQTKAGTWRLLVDAHDAPDGTVRLPEHKTVFVNGVEPVVDPVTGVATFTMDSTKNIVPANVGFIPELGLDMKLNPELPKGPEANVELPKVEGTDVLSKGATVEQPNLPVGAEVTPTFIPVPETTKAVLASVGIDATATTAENVPKVIAVAADIDQAQTAVAQAKVKEKQKVTDPTVLAALMQALKDVAQSVLDAKAPLLVLDQEGLKQNAAEQERAHAQLQTVLREAQEIVKGAGRKGPNKVKSAQLEWEAMKDPVTGERKAGFESAAAAHEWLAAYHAAFPEDKENWQPRPTGTRKTKGGTKDRGWHIAKPINSEVSLDKSRTDTGKVTLHDMMSDMSHEQSDVITEGESVMDEPSLPPEDVGNPAEVRINNLITLRDEVAKSGVNAFARVATDGDVVEALSILKQGKAVLDKLKSGTEITKLSPDEVKLLGKLSIALYDVTGKRANFTLGSKVPFDKAVVDEMGLLHPTEGLKNGLQWFAKNAKTFGVSHMGQLVDGMLAAAPDISGVTFAHPQHPEWSPGGGWLYSTDQGLRPRINAPDLPLSREDAMTWSFRLVHEFAHFLGRDLMLRTDAPAMALKKTLQEVLKELERSSMLPKKVQELIKRARKENHYDRLMSNGRPAMPREVPIMEKPPLFNTAVVLLDGTLVDLGRRGTHGDIVVEKGIEPSDIKYLGYTDAEGNVIADRTGKGEFLPRLRRVEKSTQLKGPSWDGDAMLADWRRTAGKDADTWKEVIYGALNEHELLAQTFGSPEMIAVLRSTEMRTEKASLLQFFSRAWNRLFGKDQASDNALAEILTRFDKFLDVERDGSYTTRTYVRDALVNSGVRGEALASRLRTVEDTFHTGMLKASLDGLERESANGLLPLEMQYDTLNPRLKTALLLGGPEDVFKATYNLTIDELASAEAVHFRAFEDVAHAQNAITAIRSGEAKGTVQKGQSEILASQMVKLHRMRTALDKQANALRTLQNLDNFTPQGAANLLSAVMQGRPLPAPPGPVPADVLTHAQELLGLRRENAEAAIEGRGAFAGPLGWLGKQLGLQQFMKRMHPEVASVIDHLSENQANATWRMNMLNIAFAFDPKTKSLDKVRNASIDWVIATPKAARTYSAIKQWLNVQEAAGNRWSFNDPEPKKWLSEFSTEKRKGRMSDRDSILATLQSSAARHEMATTQLWPQFFREHNNELTATIIAMGEVGMLPEQARQITTNLYRALEQLQDPAQAPQGVVGLQALSQQMSPDTYARAVQHAQGMQQSTQQFLTRMASRPNFATEQRYDAHHVRMTGPDGAMDYTSHRTQKEALAYRDRKLKEGYTFLDYVPKEDANAPSRGVNAEVMDWISEYDQQTAQKIELILGDKPELLERVLPLAQRASMLQAGLDSFKPVPGAAQRKFVGGREHINMLENEDAFYIKANNWMRHKMTRTQTTLDKLHPQLQTNRELSKYADNIVDQYLTPDNPLAQKFVKTTYFYKLALDFGQAVIESTQSLTTGMTALIGETGAVGDAGVRTQKALAAIAKQRVSRKWDNAEHQWLMEQATLRGVRGTSMWNEVYDPDRATMHEVNHARGNPVKRAVHVMDHTAKKWSTMFTTFNDDIGLLTGFDLAREKGMSQEDAFKYAVDLKNRGYFTQGKAGRAQGLWSFKTKAIPQLVSSLQNYTLGWFGLMADNYKVGFSKNPPPGMTPIQQQGARKAFLYALGAQAVFAGALGLPGVGQGIALVEQTTGVDLKGWLRQNLTTLFDEDQQDGGLMTSIALRGLSSGVTPFDPSSRMSVSVPFIGVDSYRGFDLRNLMGAPAATASDFVQGLLATARGDSGGIEKLLPNALKRPFQLWQDESDIRDKRGGLLYELSPGERAMMALGMPSSRIQNAKDVAIAADKVAEASLKARQAFADEMAKLIRQGHTNVARQRLAEYANENPNADMQAMVRNVAARVQAQSIPYDPRRTLSPGTDLQGLAPRLDGSEALRLETRRRTLQDLGGRVSHASAAASGRAARLDALQAQNPYLGLSELRQKAGMTRPHPLQFLEGSPYQ